MWDKTKEKVFIELDLIRELLSAHEPLFALLQLKEPDQIEISAVAAMLHSFYSGVENIFKRIAYEIDNNIPKSVTWHTDLLLQMSNPTALRQSVISQKMVTMLLEYLNFRHFFRHAYTMQLEWGKMKTLVDNVKTVFDGFKVEIMSFLASGKSTNIKE
jgi:hypothetical protein